MKKQTLHALCALTLFLVLTALFAACDDGYEPKAPFISFNTDTVDLNKLDEDGNPPIIVKVSIPSKLMVSLPKYRVTWAGDIDKVSVFIDGVDDDGMPLEKEITPIADEITHDIEIESQTDKNKETAFYIRLKDKDTEVTFTLSITVNKLSYEEDGSKRKGEEVLKSEITVKAQKPSDD